MLAELIDRKQLFRKQTEECQQLARNAVNKEDRAFWEKAAKHWQQQFRRTGSSKKRIAGAGKSENGSDRSKVTPTNYARKKDGAGIAAPNRPGFFARWFARASD